MISVEKALTRITARFEPVPTELVGLSDALGRVLAEDVPARLTQPRAAVSAMDGYAVRAEDVAAVPATLTCIGEAAAGTAFDGVVGPGQAVRIFTGGPVPDGANAVVIQENAEHDGDRVIVEEIVTEGRHIRPAGLDFRVGNVELRAGRVLSARDVGLAAAMNVPWLAVRRRPRVAVLATGDELVLPGDPLAAHQIVSSSALALVAAVRAWGGTATYLGIARDRPESLQEMSAGAQGMDLLLTTGGASVGEHDLVRSALAGKGLKVDFWKIAMRPGKPLIFGDLGSTPMLGLPGNPVSSLVCAVIFLRPVLARLLGIGGCGTGPISTAVLGSDLASNDRRQDYLRARFQRASDGTTVVVPYSVQDSSMLACLAHSDCLIVRAPNAAPATAGERVEIVPLETALATF